MHFAYKIINGVLHIQSMPHGPWKVMSAEQITARLAEVERDHSRALLEAHQRGRREGMEEARFAIALERLEEPSDSEGDQAYQTAIDDCERAIRAKMEEQP